MKKSIIKTGFAALFLLLSTSQVFAQGAGIEWDTLNQEVMELYRTGDYDRAVTVAKKALKVAEKALGPDHPSVATSLNNLALLYATEGQYAQAEPLYKRSLAIWEKALGPDHPNVAASLNNLAALFQKTGRDKEAQVLDERATRIRAIQR
jgi:tetratricopeptide (TPR) repeat protein